MKNINNLLDNLKLIVYSIIKLNVFVLFIIIAFNPPKIVHGKIFNG